MLNIYNYHTHPEKLIKATHIIEQDGGLFVGNFFGDTIILSKKSMQHDKLSWDDAKEYCDDLGDGWQLPPVKIINYIFEQSPKFVHFEDYNMDADVYWTSNESADYATVITKYGHKQLTVKTHRWAVRPVKVL